MKNPRKLSRARKTLPPDKVMAPLISWLNSEQPDSVIHRMVFEIQALDRLADEIDWSGERQDQASLRQEFRKRGESITSKMREFATYPAIFTNRLYRLPSGEWKAMREKPYEVVHHRYAASADPETAVTDFHQTLPFRDLEQILERGWAWRLRKCALTSCGRWFCARRGDQIHCPGERCRQRRYEESPQYKEWRKNYDAMQKKKSFGSTSRKS